MPVSFPGSVSGVGLATQAMLVSGPSALVAIVNMYVMLVLAPAAMSPRVTFVTAGTVGVTPSGSRSW